MKIEDQVCTPEQANRFKELGVTAQSLHQWWKMKYPASEEAFAKNRANCLITPTGDNHDRFIMHYIDNENAAFHWEEGTYNDGWDHSRCELEEGPLAAYNVAELGKMLPDWILRGDVDAITESGHGIGSWPTGTNWGARVDYNIKKTEFFPTEAQARAYLLIHLLESNLITTEEINNRLKQ